MHVMLMCCMHRRVVCCMHVVLCVACMSCGFVVCCYTLCISHVGGLHGGAGIISGTFQFSILTSILRVCVCVCVCDDDADDDADDDDDGGGGH